jgi:hypothetical protein
MCVFFFPSTSKCSGNLNLCLKRRSSRTVLETNSAGFEVLNTNYSYVLSYFQDPVLHLEISLVCIQTALFVPAVIITAVSKAHLIPFASITKSLRHADQCCNMSFLGGPFLPIVTGGGGWRVQCMRIRDFKAYY